MLTVDPVFYVYSQLKTISYPVEIEHMNYELSDEQKKRQGTFRNTVPSPARKCLLCRECHPCLQN
jgi:hypothetical protein